VTVNLLEAYVKAIDELIKLRLYASRSELIRIAVCNLIQKYMHSLKDGELAEADIE